MAAFDPIEFFGIGHGRDTTIVRHARNRSGSSLCLSAAGAPSSTALEQRQAQRSCSCGTDADADLRPSASNCPLFWPSKEPKAASTSSFENPTPDDSLLRGQVARRRNGLSSPESSDVSSNSSQLSADDEHTSLELYILTRERHELITLGLPTGPEQAGNPSPASGLITLKFHGLTAADSGSPNGQSAHSQTPINRYLSDVFQTHERLSLAVKWPDQDRGLEAAPELQGPQCWSQPSSISLSDGYEASEGGEGSRSPRTRMMISKYYQERKQRIFDRGEVRTFREARMRKRRPSWLVEEGHKEKKARTGSV